jgi:hypothetical protein
MKASTIQKTAKTAVQKAVKPAKTLCRRAGGKIDKGSASVSFATAKSSEVDAASTKNVENAREIKKRGWNSMLHLSIKRFDDNDPTLTAGAKRDRLKHPHVVVVERDPSGRSICKHCGIVIQPKGVTRISLMMVFGSIVSLEKLTRPMKYISTNL